MTTRINNRYTLLEIIGSGAMGTVYRASDRLTGEVVALKQVQMAAAGGSTLILADQISLRLALAQEFGMLATLRHPNIISVLDYGFDGDQRPFFTMNLLQDALPITAYAEGKSDAEKAHLLLQALQALAYLHRRDVLHRDIKPANTLVTPDGQVKVLDFGLAVALEQIEGVQGGTLSYMAPEIIRDGTASRASDLYSLGVIAYELFVGRHPFEATLLPQLVVNILNATPDVSALDNLMLALILSQWLLKDPSDRYASAETITLALCEAVGMDLPPESIAIRESFLQAAQFVGRTAELGDLKAAFERAREGYGSSWLIEGESGVGKSRLVDELRPAALVSGALVLSGQAAEDNRLPYQLWRNALPQLLLSATITDQQAAVLKEIVPNIEQLTGKPISTSLTNWTALQRQQLVTQAILSLFRQQKQTVLLILEDLQWAIRSILPLKLLMEIAPELPLLIVGTFRDADPTVRESLPEATLIRLKRFQTGEVERLSAAILGDVGKQPEVVRLIRQESEGNAFFVVEIIRALAEDAGELSQIGIKTLPPRVFTGGIQQIVERRLANLTPEHQPVLKLAAVLGREIDPALLRVHHDSALVESWLLAGMESAVLDVQDNAWRFAHDQLREGVRRSMKPEEQQFFHRQAAIALETLYPDSPTYNPLILTHWRETGDREKVIHYLLLVGRQLVIAFADFEAAKPLLEECAAIIPDDHPQLTAFWNLQGILYRELGDYDTAFALIERAYRLAEKHGDLLQKGSSVNSLGIIAKRQGKLDLALEYSEKALDIARMLGKTFSIFATLTNLAAITSDQGAFDASANYSYEALAVLNELQGESHYLMSLAATYGNLGHLELRRENMQAAFDLLQRSLDLSRKHDFQRQAALNLNNLGMLYYHHGDDEQADTYLNESIIIKRKMEDVFALAYSLIHLGFVKARRGDGEAAVGVLKEALAMSLSLESEPMMQEALLGLVWVDYLQARSGRNLAWVGMVQYQPSLNIDVRRRLVEIHPPLQAAFPDALPVASERGRTLDLREVVGAVLRSAV